MLKLKAVASVMAFILIIYSDVHAQESNPTHMIRLYEDNDCLNIWGKGTDNSYTNGTRLDFFYTKKRPPHFIDRLMPVAGDSSTNIFGWNIMQVMITPSHLRTKIYQANDYQYAGALYITHSLYSYNEKKKYDFQTGLMLGVRGPIAFGEEVQSTIHQLIGDPKPMGWNNQLRTIPLLNINFTIEKQLHHFGSFVELIGGAQIAAGTFLDAVTVYPLIRIGRMSPYFSGLFNQHGSYYSKGQKIKTQFYSFIRPRANFILHNALFKGNSTNKVIQVESNYKQPADISHYMVSFEFGAVIAHGHFSMAYTQTHSTAYNKGLYDHSVGNLTLSVTW